MTSCDSFADSFSSSLHNPPAYKRPELLQSFTTQAIKETTDSETSDSEGEDQVGSELVESPQVEDIEGEEKDKAFESPPPNEGGIWGTRPLLDKDNMTHQKISEIVQQTFGLESLTPLLSPVQNILETDPKYSSKKWTGTQPKVRQVWL
jgi:hypothetical protein